MPRVEDGSGIGNKPGHSLDPQKVADAIIKASENPRSPENLESFSKLPVEMIMQVIQNLPLHLESQFRVDTETSDAVNLVRETRTDLDLSTTPPGMVKKEALMDLLEQHQKAKKKSGKEGLQPVSTITLPVGSTITQDELLEVLTAFPDVKKVNGFKWNNKATINYKDLEAAIKVGMKPEVVKINNADLPPNKKGFDALIRELRKAGVKEIKLSGLTQKEYMMYELDSFNEDDFMIKVPTRIQINNETDSIYNFVEHPR